MSSRSAFSFIEKLIRVYFDNQMSSAAGDRRLQRMLMLMESH